MSALFLCAFDLTEVSRGQTTTLCQAGTSEESLNLYHAKGPNLQAYEWTNSLKSLFLDTVLKTRWLKTRRKKEFFKLHLDAQASGYKEASEVHYYKYLILDEVIEVKIGNEMEAWDYLTEDEIKIVEGKRNGT